MKKGIKKYFGALMMGTALVAVPSCTDTWTEHYTTEDAYTANENLWELLESREDLSNFRSIISKAKFYRDETHPAFTLNGEDTVFYTFKDVLCANTPITVWAPSNDAIGAEEWARFEEMAKTEAYNLQQQFIGNHIALHRKNMAGSGTEKIRLINSKLATVNNGNSTFEKTRITEKNIGAKNGVLHIIDSRNEFFFNLYEYVKFSGDVTTFQNYLIERDTVYFSEEGSIEGLPDENGNPTYVDSAYIQNNMLFNRWDYNPTNTESEDAWVTAMKMCGAQLNTEDSTYVMIVPTDKAWSDAVEMLKPYYNYVEKYPRMVKVKNGTTNSALTVSTKNRHGFKNGMPHGTVDSLQLANIEMDIVSPLVFNANLQKLKNGRYMTAEQFINGGYRDCEYLLTTHGDTIRDFYEDVNGVKTLTWSKNSLFESEDIKEIKEMSNGYAFITDKWNYSRDYWMRDIDIDANYKTYWEVGTTTKQYRNTNSAGEWINEYGQVSKQDYLQVYTTDGNTAPEIIFELNGSNRHANGANVMSGKYDVQIVLVPNWYNSSDSERDPNATVMKNRLICTLYYWDQSMVSQRDYRYNKQKKIEGEVFEYSGEKVDTITVMTDVEFPVSYQNVIESFPTISIKSDKLIKNKDKDETLTHSYSFNIDRIILKSKSDK